MLKSTLLDTIERNFEFHQNEVRSRAASADLCGGPQQVERSSEQMNGTQTAANQSNLHHEWMKCGLEDTRNARCFRHDVS